jgi:uncharacterized RDD family membrane protein YckC
MRCPQCSRQIPSDARRCVSCGKKIPPGQALLDEAGVLEDEGESSGGPGTTSSMAINPRFVRPTNRVATIGDRLIATVLDGLLMAAFFAVLGTWAAVHWNSAHQNGVLLAGKPLLLTFLLTALFAFFYFWLLEAWLGVTLGKAMAEIQVRSRNGDSIGMRASLIRNLLRLVDGIAAYLVGGLIAEFSKKRQRLGDHLAGTIVIETERGEVAQAGILLLWFAIMIAAGWGSWLTYRSAPSAVLSSGPAAVQAPAQSAAQSATGLGASWRLLLTDSGVFLRVPYVSAHFAFGEQAGKENLK